MSQKSKKLSGREQGFTLIELLIAVSIVAILASIAVPSYLNYVVRTNRTVAKSYITELVSKQESFFVDRKRYATALTQLGLAADTVYLRNDGTVQATATGAIYSVTLENPTNTSFTIAATPVNSQTRDTDCLTLKQTSQGVKSATGPQGIDCWRR